MRFKYSIDGIPCIIEVTYYSAGTNRPINSASLEPNDPEDFEYTVLDRGGYQADWLARKVCSSTDLDIYQEFKERISEQ